MLGNIDPEKLMNAKAFLEGLKGEKLAIVAPKHLGDKLTFWDLIHHFSDEVYEFRLMATSRTQYKNDPKILDELADISNMVDLLVMKILEERDK